MFVSLDAVTAVPVGTFFNERNRNLVFNHYEEFIFTEQVTLTLTSSKRKAAVCAWSLSTAAISGVIPSISWYCKTKGDVRKSTSHCCCRGWFTRATQTQMRAITMYACAYIKLRLLAFALNKCYSSAKKWKCLTCVKVVHTRLIVLAFASRMWTASLRYSTLLRVLSSRDVIQLSSEGEGEKAKCSRFRSTQADSSGLSRANSL